MYDRTRTRSPRRPSPASRTPAASHDTGNATDVRAGSLPVARYHTDPSSDAPTTPSADDRTSRERLGWQVRAARVLADLLALALRDGLPRIAWTVGDVGANLAGRCYGRTGADRRHQFQAWCTAVGATPKPELTRFGGVTYLRAVAARYDGLVDVIVLADLYTDQDETRDA